MDLIKIKNLSNSELDQQLKNFVSKEREVLGHILNHIVEVDRRKLYLAFAYPSLFDYLTKHVGYSAGSAQRRIDAARLSREVPEVIDSLENGTLNLAQVNLIQKAARQSYQETQSKVSVSTKKELLFELSGKSFSESQILVHKHLDLKIKEQSKEIRQKDESVRLELTLSKQQWEKLNQMRDLLSHSLPNGSWDQLLEYLSDKVIAQKKSKKNDAKVTKDIRTAQQGGNRIHIPKAIRNYIFERDRCCQFVNEANGKICSSTWQLQVDHIQPVWAGGKDSIENLRLLCANHNRERYREQTNVRQV